MPRRFTDTGKWADPWFSDLPYELKFLWLYILDNCDYAGIWKPNIKLAEFQMGLTPPWGIAPEKIPEAFSTRVTSKNGYWFILKFMPFQYGQGLNKGDAVRGAIQLVDSKGFLESLQRVSGVSLEGLVTPKAKAMAKAKANEEDGFNDFWERYPRKDAKKPALKAWIKINPGKELLDSILSAIDLQKQTPQWLEDNGKYIQLPATWLNQQRWEDKGKKEEVPWDQMDPSKITKKS